MTYSFPQAVRTCLSRYATFRGRAPRSEFWWFVVFNLIAALVAFVIDGASFGFGGGEDAVQPVSSIMTLALFLPNLAVAVRRLHDIGRTGWWVLLSFVPLIGILILIWWYATRGEPGANAYGPPAVQRPSF